MAFSFDPTLATNKDQVRFWTGDTNSSTYYLDDATITALLTIEGGIGPAVMAAFDFILANLTRVDAQTVDTQTGGINIGRTTLEAVLAAQLRASRRFGLALNTLSVNSVNVYRADSQQIAEPNYANGTDGVLRLDGTYDTWP